MTLPVQYNTITMNNVNVELGLAGTALITMNDAAVRTLAGVPSGAISMNNLHGKSNTWAATISTNQQEMNLRTWADANGYNGTSGVEITIGTGVYIWSDNTATPALTTGSFPGAVKIINKGYIMGKGGDGAGVTDTPYTHIAATVGGPAMSLNASVTINLATYGGYIGGGGGGGECAGLVTSGMGGGGAGGGRGGYRFSAYTGTGGSIGGYGTASSYSSFGSGGGRIFPGVGGTGGTSASPFYTGGAGGSANNQGGNNAQVAGSGPEAVAGSSGAGGGGGAVGGAYGTGGEGGGGGWGAAGGTGNGYATNTPGGKAIALNGYSVTWVGSSANCYGAVT